jgi:hypothetical protein
MTGAQARSTNRDLRGDSGLQDADGTWRMPADGAGVSRPRVSRDGVSRDGGRARAGSPAERQSRARGRGKARGRGRARGRAGSGAGSGPRPGRARQGQGRGRAGPGPRAGSGAIGVAARTPASWAQASAAARLRATGANRASGWAPTSRRSLPLRPRRQAGDPSCRGHRRREQANGNQTGTGTDNGALTPYQVFGLQTTPRPPSTAATCRCP